MKSTRILITAPTADVIDLAECKAALGITTTSQDAIISAALEAAVDNLDPAAGGWLGRALRRQTWELQLSGFPYCREEIRLPYPPLVSVDSVKYDDSSGAEHVLTEGDSYQVIGVGSKSFGKIVPAYNVDWPSARCIDGSVRIRFTCGYAVGSDSPEVADAMPGSIKQAVVLMVRSVMSSAAQNQFLTQDSVVGVGAKSYVVSAEAVNAMQQAAEILLSPYESISL